MRWPCDLGGSKLCFVEFPVLFFALLIFRVRSVFLPIMLIHICLKPLGSDVVFASHPRLGAVCVQRAVLKRDLAFPLFDGGRPVFSQR